METIVALGIFSVIVSAGVLGFIPALQSGRTGREQTQAVSLAREGIEAVRSLRDRDFANLAAGTYGIGVSNNLWKYSGVSDSSDKFVRTIQLSVASRDAGGSLVSSGGTTDPDTFLVTSRIAWNHSIGDTRQISIESYLTNWRKSIGGMDGLILYGNGTVLPRWRTYTSNTDIFSSENSMPSLVGNPRNFAVQSSPTKVEAIAGMLSTDGKLYIYCFDGTVWSQDWSVTIGVGTTRTKPFDIAYETTSGDAVVIYSTNVASSNELNLRTKSGTNSCGSASWSSPTAFDPVRTSGVVSWVKMITNPKVGSNLIGVIWADWNKDLSGAIWSGTALANEMPSAAETSLEAINTGATFPDVNSFDLAYESVSGDLMTIWGISTGANGTNGVRYRLCTGDSATCSWGAITTPPTFSDDATSLDLAANPNSDEIVFASIGNAGSDLQAGYWSGVGWTNTANLDISSRLPAAGSKLVSTGWLISGSTSRSVVLYQDNNATNIGWYVGNRGVFTLQTDTTVSPPFVSPQTWYESATNPKSKDQLMFTIADNNNDLFAKRLSMTSAPVFSWTASDGSTQVATSLGQNISRPYAFTYFIQ